MSAPVLDVSHLSISFGIKSRREVVSDLSFLVNAGETVAIVGESGSGKSVTALAIMGLLPERVASIGGGSIRLDGRDLLDLGQEDLRALRGPAMGMIFQEPMTSLNPVLSIGRQMTEGLQQHTGLDYGAAFKAATEMLEKVGIPHPAENMRRFPHQFSGGMRQRVMIASAMIMRPRILIADEPTTALDVTVQAQIMDLMRSLVRDTGTSLLLITHDMGIVAENADRVVVTKAGRMIEQGPTEAVFLQPVKEYTRGLLASVPRIANIAAAPAAGPKVEPALELTNICKTFARPSLFRASPGPNVLKDVSLSLAKGETLALVGESGSGKSTLGRIACRLLAPDSGDIAVTGTNITQLSGRKLRQIRSEIQMIFQDPFASLDPRFSVGRTLAEPLGIKGMSQGSIKAEVARLLDMVRLPSSARDRLPHQFSGGQRQRVAIARALAAEPSVIVADEPTSALDVSIQAEILALLREIQRERGVSYLFITHDLAVVATIATSVAVLKSGVIVERGSTSKVLTAPRHSYTQALLSAVPIPDPRQRRVQLQHPPIASTYLAGELSMIDQDHWVRA